MKKETYTYGTYIKAIDPKDNTLKEWAGPDIEASSKEEANRYLQENGLGYCKVVGRRVDSFIYLPPKVDINDLPKA